MQTCINVNEKQVNDLKVKEFNRKCRLEYKRFNCIECKSLQRNIKFGEENVHDP